MHPNRSHNEHQLIIGRERERQRLRAALDDALAAQGGLVLVSGEAGIGKTVLIEELAGAADELGVLVLGGGCYDLTTTPPYGPWVEVLRAYPDTPDFPPIPQQLREQGGIESVASQEQLFQIVAGFLTDIAAAGPLVLILEDLHWADHASIDLLRYLARQLSQQRILMLASYRDDELTRTQPLFTALPLLVREARAERLELQPFDRETLGRLVARQYPLGSHATRTLGDYLLQYTEGNPLFAAELLRSLERERVLCETAEGWRLAELDEVVPPPLVVQMIERQLAVLDDGTRAALEVAAVLGHELELELWQQLAGLDDDPISVVIGQALTGRVLEPQRGAGLRFRHALIREVLYQGMMLPKRRRIHRQAAERLLEAASPDPDAVASHFQRAGDERAAHWLIQAGNQAQRALAHTVAAERFEAALSMYGDDPTTGKERAWLAWRVSRMLTWADGAKSRRFLELAAQLAQQAGVESLVALCAMVRGIQYCGNGEGRRGLQELKYGRQLWNVLTDEERIEALPKVFAGNAVLTLPPEIITDRVKMTRLSRIYPGQGMLSAWLSYVGRFTEAVAVAEQLVADVNEVEIPSDQHIIFCRGAYAAMAVANAALGRPDESQRMFDRLRESHRLLNAPVSQMVSATMQLLVLDLPYYPENLAERRRLAETASDAHSRIDQAFPSMVPGNPWFEIIAGNWRKASDLLHEYLKQSLDWGWRMPFLSLACWLERHTGELDAAWSRIHECLPAGPRSEPGDGQFMFTISLLRRAIELSLDVNALDQARTWLTAHDRWLDWADARAGRAQSRLLWARFWLQRDDPATARREAETAMRIASELRQPLSLLASHRLLGELAIVERRFDEAERELTQALQLADASAIRYERTLTLMELAKLHTARQEHSAARALLDEIRVHCRQLDANPLLAQIAQLERQLIGGGFPAGLSAREAQVLQLIASGMSDAEIAARLYISPRTVNRHTTSIYNKLNVNSRVAATRFAIDHQLI